jgi:tRNA(adenine34) deaminase
MSCHMHRARHAGMAHSRRFFVAGFACAALLPSASGTQARDASAADEAFMRMAIEEARQADFPFGAVIVRDGSIIARGRNLGRTNDDPTAHGEMVAIRRCLADHGSAALRGSTLYTSGEPCAMCMGQSYGAISAGWSMPLR